MPYDWTVNWIKPLHKGKDINNVNNYRTIMVTSLMAKLFGCIKESNISEWTEKMVKELIYKLTFEKIVAPSITMSPLEY